MTTEIYYRLERKEHNPDDTFCWIPLDDTRSNKPIDCEGRKNWRCVKVTIITEEIPENEKKARNMAVI